MTEQPKFQTPPVPPKVPAFGVGGPTFPVGTPAAADTGLPENNFAKALKVSPRIFETKIMAGILGGCVVVGMLLGMVFFGGGSKAAQGPVQQGLMGAVPNPDIRVKMYRCGTVSETSPCLVLLANHSRNDRYAESFFEEAARLTGRKDYSVRLENSQYAKYRIAPGNIAVIKIPILR